MLGLRALRPLAGRAPVQLARRRFGGGGVHDDGGGSGLAVSATMRGEMWCCFCAWHVWTDGGSSVVGPGEKCVCVRARAGGLNAGWRRIALVPPAYASRQRAPLLTACYCAAAAPAAGAQLTGGEGSVDDDVVLDHVPRIPRSAAHDCAFTRRASSHASSPMDAARRLASSRPRASSF